MTGQALKTKHSLFQVFFQAFGTFDAKDDQEIKSVRGGCVILDV